MRIYLVNDHRPMVLAEDNRLSDLTGLVADAAPRERMTELIARWPSIGGDVHRHAAAGGEIDLDQVMVRAPLSSPSKIVAAPVNYRRHQEEMGGPDGVYSGATIKTIESYACFLKAPSSIVGPDRPIELPYDDRRFDHEGELGVVIGPGGYRIGGDEAMAHVFGYVPLLDITMRGEEERTFRKSFDTFTPIGPAIVTADEVADVSAIDFRLWVGAECRQRGSISDLIYDIPRLIELSSSAMTLNPGDLIATGTPEGVGPIVPGDRIRLDIRHVGELTMDVSRRPEPAQA